MTAEFSATDMADAVPSGEWREEKPEARECIGDSCSTTIEPTPHPSGDGWLAPDRRCRECRDRHHRRRDEAQWRVRTFRQLWGAVGAPERKHQIVSPNVEADALFGEYQALRETQVGLFDELRDLVEIDPHDQSQLDSGCYLHGPTGAEKTTRSVAAAREYLVRWVLECDGRRRPSVKYANTVHLVETLKEGYGRGDGSAGRRMRELLEADFLVLDELGAATDTPHTAQKLTRLIDHRVDELLPTVWVSNFGLSELADESRVYDDRVRWRLFEHCGGSDGDFRSRELSTNRRDPSNREKTDGGRP